MLIAPGGAGDAPVRRVAGVSLKMYFGLARTRAFLEDVARLGPHAAACGVDAFVIPDFVSLHTAAEVLRGTGIRFGAQDVYWEDAGAFTGEISAATLRDVGCTLVELGHSERRLLFGEDDVTTARKAATVARHGLVPLVCVGEAAAPSAGISGTRDAISECRPQVEAVIDAIPRDSELMLAYEPRWAIGGTRPAPAEHIVAVVQGLRDIVGHRSGGTRFLYGGSAGQGMFAAISAAVDGLFLGRNAHEVGSLKSVLSELAA